LWNTGVIEVRALSDGPVQAGTRGLAVQYLRRGRAGYHEAGCAIEVLRFVEGRELLLDLSAPHLLLERSKLLLQFDPLGPRTRLAAAEEMFWAIDWVGFVRPVIWLRRKRELRKNLRRLRAALQAGELPPPPRRPGGGP